MFKWVDNLVHPVNARLTFFDDDAEKILFSILMYLDIVNKFIYNGFLKLKSTLGF